MSLLVSKSHLCGDLKPIRSAPFTFTKDTYLICIHVHICTVYIFERLPGIVKKYMLQCELMLKGPSLLLKNMCLLCLSQYITSPPPPKKNTPNNSQNVHPNMFTQKEIQHQKISTNNPPTKTHSQKKTQQNNTKHTHQKDYIPTNQPKNIPAAVVFFKRNQKKKPVTWRHTRWMPLAHQYPVPWRFQTSLRSGWEGGDMVIPLMVQKYGGQTHQLRKR